MLCKVVDHVRPSDLPETRLTYLTYLPTCPYCIISTDFVSV